MIKGNNIIPFIFDESPVRVVRDEIGEPWFVAKDICRILEITNVSQAVDSLDDDEKLLYTLHISGQERETWAINKPGLYTLMIRSNKPQAKPFRRWITHEVLPSLEKTGKYSMKVSEEDIIAALGMDMENLKNTHRVKIMEITRYVNSLDDAGKRRFLLTYSQLCGIVGGRVEKPATIIADKGVQTFLEERCSFESYSVTTKSGLYDEYVAYATAKGYAVINRSLFFKWLYQYGLEGNVSDYRPNKDGMRVKSLRGVKLN